MAESETDCDTPGLDTLGSECVIAHTQVGDLHYGAETEIMTQEDKRLDLEAIHGDLGAVTCVDVVTEGTATMNHWNTSHCVTNESMNHISDSAPKHQNTQHFCTQTQRDGAMNLHSTEQTHHL